MVARRLKFFADWTVGVMGRADRRGPNAPRFAGDGWGYKLLRHR